jgi:hypothetical protein
MKIIDIKFLGGKQSIKLLAFRRKFESNTGIGGSGINNNPTFSMVKTALGEGQMKEMSTGEVKQGGKKVNNDNSEKSN